MGWWGLSGEERAKSKEQRAKRKEERAKRKDRSDGNYENYGNYENNGNFAIKREQRVLADYAEREQQKECEAGLI